MYISTNTFTMKSDIYSFGVIIFELITAIHPQQNLMEYINLVSFSSLRQSFASIPCIAKPLSNKSTIAFQASMSPDGVEEILDNNLAGKCNIEEVRSLASIGHKCLQKLPRKRPSIGDVSQAIVKIKQRRLAKEDTMSFASKDLSRAVSRIEDQQVELTRMASVKDRATT